MEVAPRYTLLTLFTLFILFKLHCLNSDMYELMSLWAKCLVSGWVEWSLWLLLEHFTVLINALQIQIYHLSTSPTIYTHYKSKLLPLFQIKGPFCDIGSVCLNKIVIFDLLDVLDEDFYDKIEYYCLWQTLS